MRLDDALDQIADIRRRMAGGTTFRGYRSTAALFSAAVAGATAAVQAAWLPRPAERVLDYLALWCGAAVACAPSRRPWACGGPGSVGRAAGAGPVGRGPPAAVPGRRGRC